jgi:hypothetical protein
VNRRIAKKVLRRSAWHRYSWPQIVRARDVIWRTRIHSVKRTPGQRWGRWDPSRPTDPNDLPF